MKEQSTLFENIALTFSGGGFRAAAYSLGVLSYLNQVKFKESSLLQKVKGLSTVSGGTITGAAYAQSQHKGESFEIFSEKLVEFLSGDKILNQALANMEDHSVWAHTDKRHSLINAFSIAYHDDLKVTMGDLMTESGHLEDICFNATDFSFGMAFRFQINGDFGNYRLKVNKQAKQEIKVSDAVASSSCFPMGFAPMIMPDDYLSHSSEPFKELKEKEHFKKGIGIMDGGIVDNQGIGSTMLADNRRATKGKSAYDLVLVCDVASYAMEPWEQDQESAVGTNSVGTLITRIVRIAKASWPFLLSMIVGLSLTVLVAFCQLPAWLYVPGGMAIAFGLVLLALHLASTKVLNKIKSKLEHYVPAFFLKKIKYFDDLKTNLLRRMIQERATSGLTMISDVFLKQIRRLNYQLFYTDDKLKNRRASALIYTLTEAQFNKKESTELRGEPHMVGLTPPSQLIFKCAKIASDMGTTLWFDAQDEKRDALKNLIASGRFTTCYTLIEYLTKLSQNSTVKDKKEIDDMKALLIADWEEFVKDPFWELQQ